MPEARGSNDQLVAANEDAGVFFRRHLLGRNGSGPREYLSERGFDALLEDSRWAVGYAPASWTALHDYLADLGYSDETLNGAGLTFESRNGEQLDVFRDRLTFGVRDVHKSVIGFVGRRPPNASDLVPKYLNTRRTPIYDKSSVLFGRGEIATDQPSTVLIAEGPLDAIAFDLALVDGPQVLASMAICGTSLTAKHASAVLDLNPSQVIIGFDPDAAGSRALASAYELLRTAPHLQALASTAGADPAAVFERSGSSAIRQSLERAVPAADLLVDEHIKSWPAAQNGAESDLCLLREALLVVRRLRSQDVARQVARLAELLPFHHTEVTRELVELPSPVRESTCFIRTFDRRQMAR